MEKTQQSSSRITRISMLTLVVLVLLGCAPGVFGQWVNNGSNINNTNIGNVGIGTTTPGAGIDVVNSAPAGTGTARFKNTSANTQVVIDSAASQNANLRLDNNASPVWYLGNEAINNRFRFINSNASGNSEVFTILQSGNIGIGTANPAKKLHVSGSNSQIFVDRTSNAAGNYALVNFATGGISKFIFGLNADAGTGVDKLSVFDAAVSATAPVMTFTGGNIGIATTAPTEKLHVIGNVKIVGDIDVSGNIKAKYQDMAEWVESSQQLSAATVVVLDSANSNQVVASTQSYDTRVAGVISLNPGLTLGEQGEGRVLVATTGRVKVKVDASNGPIQIGDLLVTSDKAGVAMKSVPVNIGGVQLHRPGTLIGKALEPLDKGTGEILVLLSLQ